MKRIIALISCLFILTACTNREDYFVFSFDDYSLSVGYDNVEFLDLVFNVDAPNTLDPYETLKDVEVTFWKNYFADVDITNYRKKPCDLYDGVITRLDIFLDNIEMEEFKLDDRKLSSSVKDNCRKFDGEYIERNGYACVIVKQVKDKNNVVILYGDILKPDQDELSRIEIYVE